MALFWFLGQPEQRDNLGGDDLFDDDDVLPTLPVNRHIDGKERYLNRCKAKAMEKNDDELVLAITIDERRKFAQEAAKRMYKHPVLAYFRDLEGNVYPRKAECLICKQQLLSVTEEDKKEGMLHLRDQHRETFDEVIWKCLCFVVVPIEILCELRTNSETKRYITR